MDDLLKAEACQHFSFMKGLTEMFILDSNSSSGASLDDLGMGRPPGCDDLVDLTGCGSYTYPLWFLVSLMLIGMA